MQKAAIYVRVSTDKQAAKGLSIPAQKERCLEYAKNHDYEIVERDIYIDAGESARSEDRPEFQRMLTNCSSDRSISAIIVYDLSRFSRNGLEYYQTKNKLNKIGIKILSVSEAIGKENASSADWLLEWIMVGFNENRSRQDAEKILMGMKRKAQDGWYPTRAPYGIKTLGRL